MINFVARRSGVRLQEIEFAVQVPGVIDRSPAKANVRRRTS
jgi:hypothetical protein